MTVDYFKKYFREDGIDLPALLNDDFMKPIKLLFQHEHYVSAAKLLFSFIDSVGYVEFGNSTANPFTSWLSTYADLTALGITAEELWEQRNSLLHMSNLDSRKVLSGKVKRLVFYVGKMPPSVSLQEHDTKYYSLTAFICAFAAACEDWLQSYNTSRDKLPTFVERYDLITSDSRMLRIDL